MPTEVKCPSCGTPVLPNHSFCEHCGSDLMVATLLAEQQAFLPIIIPDGVPIAPELLVPRIGDYLIEKGFLQSSQLDVALEYQRKKNHEDQPILLGEALLALNFISRESLDKAVTAQILELQNTLQEANLSLKQRVEERTIELRNALEQLSELNQLKSNFIANISHELRTPLTQIKGYLDILSDDALGPLNSRQQGAMTVIKRAEERLEKLIEDLIQFSLVSRGALNMTNRWMDPTSLIRSSVERMWNKAVFRRINLIADCHSTIPQIFADEDKLGWALIQLLDNALKFTPEGGEVLISCTPDEAGMIKFSIKDTGIGIPEERITEIFEPFHQLDGSSTRKFAGTGLGLAMVRQIIEAHGSKIFVHSEVGKGSIFEFMLNINTTYPVSALQSSRK